MPLQFALPVAIRIHLVNEDGALLAAVAGQIALRVAIDIEPSNQATPLGGLLPH